MVAFLPMYIYRVSGPNVDKSHLLVYNLFCRERYAVCLDSERGMDMRKNQTVFYVDHKRPAAVVSMIAV